MYDYLQELNQHKARLTSLQNIRESHSNLFAGVRAVMQNASQIGGVIGGLSTAQICNFSFISNDFI